MTMPFVLGLEESEAQKRLAQAGIADVCVSYSGRKRQGMPRVIRQSGGAAGVSLVVAFFKQLQSPGAAQPE